MARTARLAVEIDGRGARAGASSVNNELDRLKGNARGVSREMDTLGRAMRGVLAYFGGRELIRFADTANQVRSRLAALSATSADLARNQAAVFDISQRTRSELDATSQLYATLTRSAGDLGLKQAEIARITETVNKSFAITGTDSATAAGAIRQLSQALQSGVLRGDEFNTMSEAAPVLLEALAKSMGKPRSELRALAEDGKLTADKLTEAFSDPRITAGIDSQFSKITPTVQQRLTQLSNAAIVAIGKFDEATGTTQGLGAAIGFLTDNMDTLIPIAASLAVLVGTRFVLGAIQARLALVTMSAAAAGAQAPLAALAFTAGAAGRTLLAAFGGPVGIAITAIAADLAYASSRAAQSDQRFTELSTTISDVDSRLDGMKKRAKEAGDSQGVLGQSASDAASPLSAVMQVAFDTGNAYLFMANAATQAAAAISLTNIQNAQSKKDEAIARNSSLSGFLDRTGGVTGLVTGALGLGNDYVKNAEKQKSEINGYDEVIKKEKEYLELLKKIGIERDKKPSFAPTAKNSNKDRPKKDDKSQSDQRTNAQVFADFRKELAKVGIQQAAGLTGFRTAKDQNSLYQRGLTELDGYRGVSRHQTYEAFDPTRATHNDQNARKAAQAVGLKNFEVVTESGGRKHYEWKGAGSRGEVDIGASEQKFAELNQLAEQAREKITAIGSEFLQISPNVAQANLKVAELDKLIDDLKNKQPLDFQNLVADAEKLKPLIDQGLRKPFDEIIAQQERQIELSRLTAKGKYEEAVQLEAQNQLMDQMGVKSAEQLAIVLQRARVTSQEYIQMVANLGVQKQLAEQEQLRNAIIQERLSQVDQIRDNITTTIAELPSKGLGAIGNFFESLIDQSRQFFAKSITQSLFGDAFKDIENEINGKNDIIAADKNVADANNILSKSIADTATKIEQLGNAAAGASNGLTGTSAANDNSTATSDAAAALDEIIVKGIRPIGGKFDVFAKTFTRLLETFLGSDSPLAERIGGFVSKALKGLFIGQTASGLFGGVTGLNQSKTGAALGGVLGQVAGKAIGKAIGGTLGASLGPIGSALGGILGGTIGGLFKKADSGTASITGNLQGGSQVGYTGSNKLRGQLTGTASNVTSGLSRIASALGAEIGAFNVSIGKRGDNFRVSGNGATNLGEKKASKISGLLYDGKDEGEAIRIAILNAIQDGAIVGLRQGTQRLLQVGKDIEGQLDKALKFEGVFRELRAIDNPVLAAVESINKEFEGLIKIFKEAGATTAEYSDLERLYQIKRSAAITEANQKLIGSLKDYLFDLTSGTSSVLSPQLRYQNSLTELNKLDADRASGINVDASAYRSVADAFLSASRDYKGSTTGYFDDFRRITSTIENWISSEQARATTSLPSIDFSPMTAAINTQTTVTTALLQQINNNIAAIANGGSGLGANDNGATSGQEPTDYTRYYKSY
jgi:tape measure domain-containing protein